MSKKLKGSEFCYCSFPPGKKGMIHVQVQGVHCREREERDTSREITAMKMQIQSFASHPGFVFAAADMKFFLQHSHSISLMLLFLQVLPHQESFRRN